ncbi:MAG: VCBS repeat-containing protein, partial [Planctomycetota bacterium]
IVGCSPLNDATWLIEADPSEPSGFRSPVQLLDTGHDVEIADLDADGRRDIVVVDSASDAVVVVWNTDTGFVTDTPIPVGETPDMAAVADVDGDGLHDVAVVCRGDATAWVLRQQPGRGFESQAPVALGVPFPSVIELADIDSDGAVELLAAGLGSANLQVVDPAAGASETLLPMPSNVRDISVIDLGAGPRAFVLGLTGSVVLEPLFPGGPLLYGEKLALFQQPVRALPRDLDGDGDEDLAVLAQVGRSVRFVDNVAGAFPLTQGCGDGDFFMEFNIAFSARQDPDPVDQLEGLFAAWAADLEGVPDVVRSSARLNGRFASSIPGCPTTLRIELRDRDGLPASATGVSVAVGDGSTLVNVASVTQAANGVFEAVLLGTGQRGEAELIVTAEVDGRSVRLMPSPRVVVDDPADLDGDGDRDEDDLAAWVTAFRDGDPRADQNFDGVVSTADFNAWILNRNNACN